MIYIDNRLYKFRKSIKEKNYQNPKNKQERPKAISAIEYQEKPRLPKEEYLKRRKNSTYFSYRQKGYRAKDYLKGKKTIEATY